MNEDTKVCDVCCGPVGGLGCICERCGWLQNTFAIDLPDEVYTCSGNTTSYNEHKKIWAEMQKAEG